MHASYLEEKSNNNISHNRPVDHLSRPPQNSLLFSPSFSLYYPSMAINPQNLEKSDQMKWGSELQGSGQVIRSYTCAFCQRGFSNAQALGGHMNIHRRDRAKLKQAVDDQNSLPLDITLNPADHDHQPQALEEKSCSPPKREDDHDKRVGELVGGEEVLHRQLPLFVERPSGRRDDCGGGYEEKRIQTTAGVDLELRLGPEPQETREFF